jgi:hypothetical protein
MCYKVSRGITKEDLSFNVGKILGYCKIIIDPSNSIKNEGGYLSPFLGLVEHSARCSKCLKRGDECELNNVNILDILTRMGIATKASQRKIFT